MKNNLINHSNLLNIRPGNIIIENFIPGKIYRRAIEIENNSKISIIINLKSSDKSKLLLSKSFLRLGVKEKQIVELIIQDKINYQNAIFPIDPKIVWINITGDLIETKYMITLMYIQKQKKNNQTLSYNNLRIDPLENEYEMKIPSVYLTNYQKPLFDPNFMNNRKLIIDRTINFYIQRYENNRILSLKNEIKFLMKQNQILNQKNKILNLNNPKNFKIKSNSLFILGNKLDDPENKFKIDNEIEIKSLRNKNSALQVENNILVERIKDLENLISINNFETKKYDYLNYKKNEINSKENLENENDKNEEFNNQDEEEEDEEGGEEEEDFTQNENGNNLINDDNYKNNINNYDEFFFN